MKLKLITMLIIGLLPLTSFASYSYYHKLSPHTDIRFANNDNSSEETDGEDTDSCPTNNSIPLISDGYPIITKSENLVLYNTMFKTDGGFANDAEYANSSTRYKKTILVEVYLNDGSLSTTIHNAEANAYFIAQPGRDLNLRVKSGFFDTKYGFYCPYGPSEPLINKTYEELSQ